MSRTEVRARQAIEEVGRDAGRDEDLEHHEDPHRDGIAVVELARIVVVAVAAVTVWFRVGATFRGPAVVGFVTTLVGGFPIFKEAFEALAARRMTMELSMTIALLAALAIGEYFTVLVIILFVLVAEVLEGLTVGRGRRAIRDLLAFLPETVHVRRGTNVVKTTASALQAGDTVVVKPGSSIPVDGVVTAGHSFVDQAAITGESVPAEKVAGTRVYAGTINQSGRLDVRVTAIGRDTAFGRIVDAVECAEQSRAPVQRTADRMAGYLVYFALGCAAFTYLVTGDPRATISVVIVAGACGIAAGTPLAILGAIGRAARQGVIVKGGLHLETLWTADVVVLDKTGTLTFGSPEVALVRTSDGVAEDDVLSTAASAERPSEHPLGTAIVRAAMERALAIPEPETFQYAPGKGIRCTVGGEEVLVGSRTMLEQHGVDSTGTSTGGGDGASAVYVARAGRLLGIVEIADTLRPEARDAVRDLRDLGLRTVLLTGDSSAVAASVAQYLRVDEFHAGLLPEAKVDHVRSYLAGGAHVVMVGDGINDAPALMEASVGVAMGSGTALARESASILLLGNDLLKLVETIRIARRCRRIIRANFAGTLIVDGLGVALAAVGLLVPLLAAFIHVTSELAFILNSARLLPGVSRRRSPALL